MILSTSVMIGAVVGALAEKLKANKSVQDFFDDFADGTVKWIRPLFLKGDDKNEKIIEDLTKNLESSTKRKQVEIAIESHLEDAPEDKVQLQAMYEKLKSLKEGSTLTATNIEGKLGVEIKAVQNNSRATFDQLHAGDGKINIDIRQE